MVNNRRKYGWVSILSALILSSSAVSANNVDRIWGGVVGGLIGSTLVEAAYQHRQHYQQRRLLNYDVTRRRYPYRYRYRDYQNVRTHSRYRHRHTLAKRRGKQHKKITKLQHKAAPQHKQKQSTPVAVKKPIHKVFSDSQKIQKGLQELGFYKGVIDGELRSYQTRAALKKFYEEYGISASEMLEPEIKKQLIALGELFLFDRALIAASHTAEAQVVQLQTALKIHGYYHESIDGVIGQHTRDAIISYKKANMLDKSQYLDLESKYHLVKNAKSKNEQAIDRLIAAIKQKPIAGKQFTSQYSTLGDSLSSNSNME